MKRYLDNNVHFSTDNFVCLADLNSAFDPEYLKLYYQYPLADGMRDIAICESYAPTDAERLIRHVEEGKMSYICIGWLIFITHFVHAAEQKGISAVMIIMVAAALLLPPTE